MDWCSAWGRSLLGLWDPEGRPAMAPRNSLDTPKDEGTCTQWWIRSEYANMIKYAWTTPDDIQYTFWFASKRHHILSPNSATTWIAHPSLCDASPSLQWQAYQFLPFWSFLNFSPWNSQEDSFFWECFMKLTQFDNLFVLPWPRAFIDAPFAAGPTKPPGLVWTRLWKNAYKVAMGSWLRRCKKAELLGQPSFRQCQRSVIYPVMILEICWNRWILMNCGDGRSNFLWFYISLQSFKLSNQLVTGPSWPHHFAASPHGNAGRIGARTAGSLWRGAGCSGVGIWWFLWDFDGFLVELQALQAAKLRWSLALNIP